MIKPWFFQIRVEDSNVIPSAPVTEPPPRPQAFLVDVKRVIKSASNNPLNSNARVTVRVPAEYVSGVELTSDPLLNINCVEFHPVLRMQQTAILLARRGNASDVFQLTSYPIAMSLRHLDRVDAAVKGELYFLFEICVKKVDGSITGLMDGAFDVGRWSPP